MRKKTKRKKKSVLRALLRSSNLKVASIWSGSSDRPVMPWLVAGQTHKSLKKKRRVPRALRHQYR